MSTARILAEALSNLHAEQLKRRDQREPELTDFISDALWEKFQQSDIKFQVLEKSKNRIWIKLDCDKFLVKVTHEGEENE